MGDARFKGILFILSSVLLGVCAYIPIMKATDINADGEEIVKIYKMMPGVDGLLIMLPVIFCVVCALVGYQKSVPLLGAITAICASAALWHLSSRIKTFNTTIYVMDLVFNPVYGTGNMIVSTTKTYLFGFYLTILGIILTLVTSFMFGLAEKEEY